MSLKSYVPSTTYFLLSSLVKQQPKVQLFYKRSRFGLGPDKSFTLSRFSQQDKGRQKEGDGPENIICCDVIQTLPASWTSVRKKTVLFSLIDANHQRPKFDIICVHVCSETSVMSDSVRRYGLQPARLLCLWDSAGKNTGVGNHSRLQGIFLTQGSNLGLLHLSGQ